ncbi:MAG: bacteriophage T4 gp5 trimerization domain-containing protein [Methylococcales bacterium]
MPERVSEGSTSRAIGEEVIVEFLEGDPDRPIITGRVYNGRNKPPNGLPAAGMVSGLKSNSTPGGGGDNSIMLDDTKGKEKIAIHGLYDMNTTVEHDRGTTVVGGNDALTVKAGTRSVTVKGNTSLTVQAGDRIVNVTGNYKLDTTSEISMQAPSKITLTCGGSTITMEPGKITISARGGAKLVLDANALTQASAGNKVLLDGNALMDSTAGDKVLLDGTATMSSPKEAKAEAPTAILSGGGSTVKNDASGVTVNGAKISLNG